jgi:hypothetical protein
MENSMLQWSYSRIGWLHCALIGLAIHAVTPDPRDLTSGSIARILRSIVSERIPTAADPSAPGDDTADEKPDDVCTPAAPAARAAERDRSSSPSRRQRILLSARTRAWKSARLPYPGGSAATGRRLAGLGRFTC